MSSINRDRTGSRRNAQQAGGTGGASSNLGQVGIEVGADGIAPAVGIGGGFTVDATGDLGLRVAPGVSIDLTPGS